MVNPYNGRSGRYYVPKEPSSGRRVPIDRFACPFMEDQKQCFVHDVAEFYSSFNGDEATDQELEVRIRDYLADDSALEDLLDAM